LAEEVQEELTYLCQMEPEELQTQAVAVAVVRHIPVVD
jgi:hypothetical protein